VPRPVGVEDFSLGRVNALVGVRAEVVPLGLQQIRRQTSGGIAVEPGEGRGEGRGGDPRAQGPGRHLPPGGKQLLDLRAEILVQQQVFQAGIPVKGLLDPAKERAPDDAAAPPHQGDAAVVQLPAVGGRGRAHEHIALGVGDDLAGI
jgi:hypothetical protein